MTLWLNRKDILTCINERQLIRKMREAFIAIGDSGLSSHRIRVDLSRIDGASNQASAMILVPGSLPGLSSYTVKVHTKYPENPTNKMPAIQGVIQLFDARNGNLLAIMDSPLITAHRTAAAAVVATDVMARKDSHRVAIIGAGVQGEIQFRYLRRIRQIDLVSVYDVYADKAEEYARSRIQEGLVCQVASSVAEAVKNADIVITATWARSPILYADMIQPGTHISALGADEPGKVEIAYELLQQSLFVCDDRHLATQMGALNTFHGAESLPCTTLAEVLRNESPGRCSPNAITIFGSVGLPFQDLVAAWDVYKTATGQHIGQYLS